MTRSLESIERRRVSSRERTRRWRVKHPAYKSTEAARRHRKLNPDRDHDYYETYKEECAERVRQWQQKNRDRHLLIQRLAQHRRRLRLRDAAGECSVVQLQARIEYYVGRCYCCGAPWEEIDHVIPVALGGTNWPANLRPICISCNRSKGGRMLKKYASGQVLEDKPDDDEAKTASRQPQWTAKDSAELKDENSK